MSNIELAVCHLRNENRCTFVELYTINVDNLVAVERKQDSERKKWPRKKYKENAFGIEIEQCVRLFMYKKLVNMDYVCM